MNGPTTQLEWVTLVSAILAIFTSLGNLAINYFVFYRGTKKAQDDYKLKRYENLYSPLYSLFLDRSLTLFQTTKPYKLSERLHDACELFKNGKALIGIRKLFESQKSIGRRTFLLEYGGPFPINDIRDILRDNIAYADLRLISLVAATDMAYHDYPQGYDNDDVTLYSEEIDLFKHISKSFIDLNKIIFPQ